MTRYNLTTAVAVAALTFGIAGPRLVLHPKRILASAGILEYVVIDAGTKTRWPGAVTASGTVGDRTFKGTEPL